MDGRYCGRAPEAGLIGAAAAWCAASVPMGEGRDEEEGAEGSFGAECMDIMGKEAALLLPPEEDCSIEPGATVAVAPREDAFILEPKSVALVGVVRPFLAAAADEAAPAMDWVAELLDMCCCDCAPEAPWSDCCCAIGTGVDCACACACACCCRWCWAAPAGICCCCSAAALFAITSSRSSCALAAAVKYHAHMR